MCQLDQRNGTASFATICCVLRELFAKNRGGPFPPSTCARVNLSSALVFVVTTAVWVFSRDEDGGIPKVPSLETVAPPQEQSQTDTWYHEGPDELRQARLWIAG